MYRPHVSNSSHHKKCSSASGRISIPEKCKNISASILHNHQLQTESFIP